MRDLLELRDEGRVQTLDHCQYLISRFDLIHLTLGAYGMPIRADKRMSPPSRWHFYERAAPQRTA
jgi:hypothetical protein